MSGYFGGNKMTELKVQKQETLKKSPAFLQTYDCHKHELHIHEVEPEVAQICETIYAALQQGFGGSKDKPIIVPSTVRPNFLVAALAFSRHLHYHKASISRFKNFHKMEVPVLCEFIQTADFLQEKTLIDCTCEALLKKIPSKQPAEVFLSSVYWADDLSKSDVTEIMETVTRVLQENNPKDKEQGHENIKHVPRQTTAIVPKPNNFEDTRSINQLLHFIDGGNGGNLYLFASSPHLLFLYANHFT
ncbi:SKP1-like protein 20 [Apium graveolens]|uniref:SKP1-like protein 20 n=1 Tax=Apium graveolens TaxID=4045 RepID=UPI003D7AD289